MQYLLVPNDILPEEIYGVYGYMDDMYIISLAVLRINSTNSELVAEAWTHDGNIALILDECLNNSSKFLEDKNLKDKVLTFCGMTE